MAKKKEANVPQFQVSQVIAGKTVLEITIETTRLGRRQLYYKFKCDCPAAVMFTSTQQTVARAHKGVVQLRCDDCRYAAKLASAAASQPHKPQPKTIRAPGDHWTDAPVRPEIGSDGLSAIARLRENPNRLERAKQIILAHLRACSKNKIITDINRAWIEAEQQAQMEEGTGRRDDEWTADNRGQGLQIQRYDQYIGGYDYAPC